MRNRQKTVLALLFILSVASCQHGQTTATHDESKWDGFVQGFLDRHFEARAPGRGHGGTHEFDGRLPDWSAEGLNREATQLVQERAKAASFTDAQLKDDRQRLERDYMLAMIDGHLFWMTTAQQPYTNPQFYSDALDPNVYVTREYAPMETRVHSFIKYAQAVPIACAQIQANFHTPMSRPLVEQGILVFKGMASYISKDAIDAFSPVKDHALQAQLEDRGRRRGQGAGRPGRLARVTEGRRQRRHSRSAPIGWLRCSKPRSA